MRIGTSMFHGLATKLCLALFSVRLGGKGSQAEDRSSPLNPHALPRAASQTTAVPSSVQRCNAATLPMLHLPL
ncbi:hypothetical protein GQ54DRAFT_40308 [Martensiomyces pterosporus]|nr:hypothetical protein GQ54DRAFT_40308 [Martensiomyces pterosporus]